MKKLKEAIKTAKNEMADASDVAELLANRGVKEPADMLRTIYGAMNLNPQEVFNKVRAYINK